MTQLDLQIRQYPQQRVRVDARLVLPEMREYERSLTTVANSYVQPQVAPVRPEPLTQLSGAGTDRGPVDPAQDGGGGASGRRFAGDDADVRPGRRRHGCGVDGRADRQPGPADLRHGRHVNRCRPGAGPQASHRTGDQNRRPDGAGVIGGRADGRCRRGIDRARPRAHQGAAGRPAVRRCRSAGRYGLGGTAPTVTDANVVLGYLPTSLAGGEITLDVEAPGLPCRRSPTRWGCPAWRPRPPGSSTSSTRTCWAASGWSACSRVSTTGLRAGRLRRRRSVARQRDGRADRRLAGDRAALAGVLCALGDATTSLRDESARTCLRRFHDLTGAELKEILTGLSDASAERLLAQGLKADEHASTTRSTCGTSGRVSRSRSPSTRRG